MTRPAGTDPVTRDDLEEQLAIHSEQERVWFRDEMNRVLRAFPDGVESHRSAHESMMKAAKAEEEFWRDLKGNIATKSIWGILQILTILAAAGLAAKLGIALPFTGVK